jgi:hypothetical protein
MAGSVFRDLFALTLMAVENFYQVNTECEAIAMRTTQLEK